MDQNRDFRKKNNSNRIVQAYIYSIISNKCFDALLCSNTQLEHDNNKEILSLAKNATNNMLELFAGGQQEINKQVCSEYASSQFNLLVNSFISNEDTDDISSISNHIITEEIKVMSKQYFMLISDQSGMHSLLDYL